MRHSITARTPSPTLISAVPRHSLLVPMGKEFHISKKTAQRDVEILSCSYPIYTRTTCAGGIFAMEGWYASKSYLHDDQEALLRKLLAGFLLPAVAVSPRPL